MLSSLDGKISTGDTDNMDTDSDFRVITGVKEGLQQYYDIEKTTAFFSLNSGRVWAKIGFNEKKEIPKKKLGLNFIMIDNKPHINENGVRYVSQRCERLILITTNEKHPAFGLQKKLGNIEIIKYDKQIDFADMFQKLKEEFGAEQVTIQTGGTLNAEFLRAGLIDYVSLVIAPILIGGKDTSTLIDGESLHSEDELFKTRALELDSTRVLKNSYLHLIYKVLN